ncbi:alpha/beta fold hydrolase [Amycolatopsis sp. cmx-11-12]|uniref:alpha/beta fold hydrolase n=1 Tax=Amycolatopsis sp. cmx-11-12 TaxID=2785795 RepID=UPI0039186452
MTCGAPCGHCFSALVVAERSVIHNAREVAARLESLSPHLRVEVVPKATHGLSLEKPELVTARVIEVVPVKPGA